jgi:nitrate/nitrite-specific signal transduction histidine kinase
VIKLSTISEDKKSVLSDLIKRLGSEISTLYHTIEEDTNIPTDAYEAYEKQIENLYSILQDLEEEITFS